ncbi:hypothetical protein HYQ46_001522 [Verticillium longisporum]|nr:hypothetical protein HYQ46_001522 [Verticillium longisporum]
MPSTPSELKLVKVEAPGSDVDLEQSATVLPLLFGALVALLHAGARAVELCTHKLRAGNVGRRELDLANDLALGRDLEDTALAVHGVPEVAVRVDAEAVRVARRGVLVENTVVGVAAVSHVIIPGVHGTLCGMRVVHGLGIWRPAD